MPVRARTITPGEQLRDYLMNCFPFRPGSASFVTAIDHAFAADDELSVHLYQSTIHYCIRRLVTTADFLRRKLGDEAVDPTALTSSLRNFLKRETNFRPDQSEKLIALLLIIATTDRRRLSAGQVEAFIKETRNRGITKCYMCGVELEFEDKSQYNSAEVEHIWPHALGGTNDLDNLALACHECNKVKKTHMSASDFHYEMICIRSDHGDEHFSTELLREFRVAIAAKNGFKCATCGEAVGSIGRPEFSRRNRNDSWHFLNVDPACAHHFKR